MSSPAPPATEHALVRAIGVRALSTNVVNATVGSGIFVLPGVVAAILGPSAVIAYVVCAVAAGLVALCLAEAGSRVSATGGIYAYVHSAFGEYPGFLAGVLQVFGAQAVAGAALATVIVVSLGKLVPALNEPIVRSAMLIALFAGFAFVNIRGVRSGVRLMEVLTAAKLLPLLLLIVLGLFAVQRGNLLWTSVPSSHDIRRASLLLMFAFFGMEAALSSSGEVRNPARTVPRAILAGLSIVALLYMLIQIVSQGVLGPALATNTATPLAAVAQRAIGIGGGAFLLAAGVLSAFSYLSGDTLNAPRILYAFGRDGLAPTSLGAVHERFRTPHLAIITYAATCCALALTGTLESLLFLGSVSELLVYMAIALSVLQLRRRNVREEEPPFRIAGGPVVPLLALGVVFTMLSTTTAREIGSVAALLGVASVLYLLRRGRARRAPLSEKTAAPVT